MFWEDVFDGLGVNYCDLYFELLLLGMVLFCVEGGVLGIICVLVVLVMGIEVIKLIIGIGEILFGWLLVYDVLEMSYCMIIICKDLLILKIIELVDYE